MSVTRLGFGEGDLSLGQLCGEIRLLADAIEGGHVGNFALIYENEVGEVRSIKNYKDRILLLGMISDLGYDVGSG